MNKVFRVLLIALLSMMFMPSVSTAGAEEGQKIFKKKFRKKCGFSGVKFAKNTWAVTSVLITLFG